MKIHIYNPDNGKMSGTLSDAEKKIIDAEFSKAKPGDSLEIELLDKKGFISKEEVLADIDKELGDDVINRHSLERLKKSLGLIK